MKKGTTFMIYLSTWGIAYGSSPITRDSWPGQDSRPVKPTFFDGGPVLIGCAAETGVAYPPYPSEIASGIFWMAGSFRGTPAEFVKRKMSRMKELNRVLFDGTAIFTGSQVVFRGRSLEPFSDVTQAVFMLVDDQLGSEDSEDWSWCPVRVEPK
jgi:hypothetical protein